jgi:hypothetical protein
MTDPPYQRELAAFITEDPLEFEYDQDTGLVSVRFLASFGHLDVLTKKWMRLLLTQEVSRALLDNLPKIESLLEQAKKGRTRPDFLH